MRETSILVIFLKKTLTGPHSNEFITNLTYIQRYTNLDPTMNYRNQLLGYHPDALDTYENELTIQGIRRTFNFSYVLLHSLTLLRKIKRTIQTFSFLVS